MIDDPTDTTLTGKTREEKMAALEHNIRKVIAQRIVLKTAFTAVALAATIYFGHKSNKEKDEQDAEN